VSDLASTIKIVSMKLSIFGAARAGIDYVLSVGLMIPLVDRVHIRW
jgi:hypothetical protein